MWYYVNLDHMITFVETRMLVSLLPHQTRKMLNTNNGMYKIFRIIFLSKFSYKNFSLKFYFCIVFIQLQALNILNKASKNKVKTNISKGHFCGFL